MNLVCSVLVLPYKHMQAHACTHHIHICTYMYNTCVYNTHVYTDVCTYTHIYKLYKVWFTCLKMHTDSTISIVFYNLLF